MGELVGRFVVIYLIIFVLFSYNLESNNHHNQQQHSGSQQHSQSAYGDTNSGAMLVCVCFFSQLEL
jgi:hypothetical protein